MRGRAAGGSFVVDDQLLEPYRERLGGDEPPPARLCFAATRIVMRDDYAASAHSLDEPGDPEAIAQAVDWQATAGLRRRLDRLGFGVAEAMDTAQRFAIGWPTARRLIEECGSLGLENGFIAGAGVDHLATVGSRDELVEGVVEQARIIRAAGGQVIVLPLLWLTRNGLDEEGYVEIYGEIIRRVEGPLFLHWLGEAFHPELGGYFPGESFERITARHPDKVLGVKLSLLDADQEVRIRSSLRARGQVVLTGDDFHFARLLRGGDPWSDADAPAIEARVELDGRDVAVGDFSHGLLGALDAVAEPASLALRFLARGDTRTYLALMTPCEVVSRWIFRHPTRHYKAGLALLSWLNGLQSNPYLANHEERARDLRGYFKTAELAAAAGLLGDARLALERLAELGRFVGN